MSDPVSTSRDGPTLHVSLDRPEKLNAFSAELVDALHEAMSVAESEDVRLVVFRGAGKGFSGGFDLDGLETMSDGDLLLRFVRLGTTCCSGSITRHSPPWPWPMAPATAPPPTSLPRANGVPRHPMRGFACRACALVLCWEPTV